MVSGNDSWNILKFFRKKEAPDEKIGSFIIIMSYLSRINPAETM